MELTVACVRALRSAADRAVAVTPSCVCVLVTGAMHYALVASVLVAGCVSMCCERSELCACQ